MTAVIVASRLRDDAKDPTLTLRIMVFSKSILGVLTNACITAGLHRHGSRYLRRHENLPRMRAARSRPCAPVLRARAPELGNSIGLAPNTHSRCRRGRSR